MLSDYGFRAFLTSIGKPYDCRLWTQGSRLEAVYPCDTGYPKLNDTDVANMNRGEFVLTWRYTIPQGTSWGAGPADEAELLEKNNPVYRTHIPDLYTSASHPTVLYINMMLRRA
jgi:hypothetical protein